MIAEGEEGGFVLLVEYMKSCAVACPEKKTPMNVTKKAYIVISPKDTNRQPYQKPRAMNKYSIDCVNAKQTMMLISGRSDPATAWSNSPVYFWRTDSSIARDETVRMALIASEAMAALRE